MRFGDEEQIAIEVFASERDGAMFAPGLIETSDGLVEGGFGLRLQCVANPTSDRPRLMLGVVFRFAR